MDPREKAACKAALMATIFNYEFPETPAPQVATVPSNPMDATTRTLQFHQL